MFGTDSTHLPANALLARYVGDDNYTDCFATSIAANVTLADFVSAFYTTWLFKCERFILKWLVSRPSSDGDAEAVANDETTEFAAWSVEDRTTDELLMCDLRGRTRSWFKVVAVDSQTTTLLFGSAVLPVQDSATGERRMGLAFRMLLGFHRVYSVALLSCARKRLRRR